MGEIMSPEAFDELDQHQQIAMLLAMHLRNELENFHGEHVPDRFMPELNSTIRYALLYTVLDALVGKIPGVIAESNFTRGRSEGELRRLLGRARPILLHCGTSIQVVERRIAARSAAGERHHGHHDVASLQSVLNRIAEGVFDPLDLPAPLLRIDITSGYDPPLPDIVRFVREALVNTRFTDAP
ncbi:MAG: hypothetical protein M3Q03_05290 [Chloroflexota bacterium]|nr:hypothetical protein [Chloroflexota bacterium]